MPSKLWQFVVQEWVSNFLGSSCPKKRPETWCFLFARCSFCCFQAPIIPTGERKTVCFGGVKIPWNCDIYSWGAASDFRPFGKMPPNTLFCSLFLAPPHGEGGGLLGVKHVCCLMLSALLWGGTFETSVATSSHLAFPHQFCLFFFFVWWLFFGFVFLLGSPVCPIRPFSPRKRSFHGHLVVSPGLGVGCSSSCVPMLSFMLLFFGKCFVFCFVLVVCWLFFFWGFSSLEVVLLLWFLWLGFWKVGRFWKLGYVCRFLCYFCAWVFVVCVGVYSCLVDLGVYVIDSSLPVKKTNLVFVVVVCLCMFPLWVIS